MIADLFVFTIWLGATMPDLYLRCVDSIRAVYPQLVIVDSWGDCPLPQWEDNRTANDQLARWIMSKRDHAMNFNADVELKRDLLPFLDKTDRLWFASDHRGFDAWWQYHRGLSHEYEKMIRTSQYPVEKYLLSGEYKFIHHGYTMNNLGDLITK